MVQLLSPMTAYSQQREMCKRMHKTVNISQFSGFEEWNSIPIQRTVIEESSLSQIVTLQQVSGSYTSLNNIAPTPPYRSRLSVWIENDITSHN